MTDTQLLELVLRATEDGKLQWKHISHDRYEAHANDVLCIIERQFPLVGVNTNTYCSLTRVVVDGVLITCADGSELDRLVCLILAAAFDDMRDHERIMSELRIEAAARIQKLL